MGNPIYGQAIRRARILPVEYVLSFLADIVVSHLPEVKRGRRGAAASHTLRRPAP
jgi:hypothetical protein